jgi:hypothetical protein
LKVRVGSIAGTAAAAAVASVSSPAAAHVDPSAAARYRDSSRLSKPSPGPHYIDEDYDLCTEDFGTGRDLSSQLGGVPSQEEADEATRELRATFVQKYDPAPIFSTCYYYSANPSAVDDVFFSKDL